MTTTLKCHWLLSNTKIALALFPSTVFTTILTTALTVFPETSQAENMAAPHATHSQWMMAADELEWRDEKNHELAAWDINAWYGGDIHRAIISSEGERDGGITQAHEVHFGWERTLAPHWNMRLGGRTDTQTNNSNRTWGFASVQGLTPFFIETDVTLSIDEHGLSEFALEAEYELLLTQKLILLTSFEANFYNRDDIIFGASKGFSSLEVGTRLRYEIIRQIAPYAGINWVKHYNNTADMAALDDDDIEHAAFVAGIRLWY